VGFEYFCNAGDDLWRLPDAALASLAERDLAAIGYPGRRVVAAHAVRVRDAYPIYDEGYLERLALLARTLAPLQNLVVAGRNGTHRYDNMDRAMLSGLRAAENLLGARHDLWAVTAQDDYLEPAAPSARPSPR
jgi:protoporphyrinogen oxidase